MLSTSTTSRQLTSQCFTVRLTCLPVASPASPTVLPESSRVQRTSATCGPQCLEAFDKLSPGGSWAKTFAGLLVGMPAWYSTRCKLTWKLKVTKSSRWFFLLQASVPRTDGSASSLLPTPDCSDRRSQASRQWGLSNYAKAGLLPTPTTQEPTTMPEHLSQTGRRMTKDGTASHSLNLGRLAVMGLLPTPRCSEVMANIAITPTLQNRHKSNLEEVISGIMWSTPTAQDHNNQVLPPSQLTRDTLPGRVMRLSAAGLLPTPMAQECDKITGLENQDSLTKRARQITGETSRLSTRFVTEMMGFPRDWLERPFQVGEEAQQKPSATR